MELNVLLFLIILFYTSVLIQFIGTMILVYRTIKKKPILKVWKIVGISIFISVCCYILFDLYLLAIVNVLLFIFYKIMENNIKQYDKEKIKKNSS